MGKKKPEIIDKAKGDFVTGCVEHGVDKKTAEEIFELLKYFGGYGFNKSHSAAYGFVAYQTAWLKCHYRAEFLAATMTSMMGSPEKLPKYIKHCRDLGIEVLPGDANFLMLSGVPGLYDRLLNEYGILIRSCANYRGLDAGDVRIAVRTHGENEQLIAALREIYGHA